MLVRQQAASFHRKMPKSSFFVPMVHLHQALACADSNRAENEIMFMKSGPCHTRKQRNLLRGMSKCKDGTE